MTKAPRIAGRTTKGPAIYNGTRLKVESDRLAIGEKPIAKIISLIRTFLSFNSFIYLIISANLLAVPFWSFPFWLEIGPRRLLNVPERDPWEEMRGSEMPMARNSYRKSAGIKEKLLINQLMVNFLTFVRKSS